MNGVETIEKDGELYCIVVRANASSDNKYNFLTAPSNALQLGVNFYSPGETIRSHYHNDIQVPTCRIQEFIVIAKGTAILKLFDNKQVPIARIAVGEGDMFLLLQGGHGFDVTNDLKLVEVKQGPYQEGGDKVLFD